MECPDYISKVLCLQWQWYQPSGRLKDMACREILLTLKRKGLITLPEPLRNANNHKRNKNIPKISVDQTPLQKPLCQQPPVEVTMVRGTQAESFYNSLVHHHHYLGYRQIVGNHLKYIAYIGDRPVACLGWGSAAWSV